MPNPCKEELEELLMREHPDLSKQQAQEILAGMNMREEDIDLSDIPETDFSKGVRGLFYRGSIVHLDEDLQSYFGELSRRKGVPLSGLVNDALRKAVAVGEAVR
jgi:hypothetical protein